MGITIIKMAPGKWLKPSKTDILRSKKLSQLTLRKVSCLILSKIRKLSKYSNKKASKDFSLSNMKHINIYLKAMI